MTHKNKVPQNKVPKAIAIVSSFKVSHTKRGLSLAAYSTAIGSAALVLTACQSTPSVSRASQASPIIDFSIADTEASRAQSHLFNAGIDANTAHYDYLFDEQQHPNSDNKAKHYLVSAIRQHLATEHVAVAKANYHLSPLVNSDSIDAGSSSLFETALEMIAYQESMKEDDEDLGGYGDASDVNNILEPKSKINPTSLLEDYEALQLDKQSKTQSMGGLGNNSDNHSGTEALSFMLSMLQKTPEQLEARNAYQLRYLTLNSVSQYKPSQRQFKSVYSYDYIAPTASASLQLPVAFDFDTSRLTVDPSALMPVMALMSPENTPLPNQMISHTVDIGLPEVITSQIPSAVIYDATISAVQASLAELDPEVFSLIDISDDDFAAQLGAAQGIKVYFGSKQTGEVIGKIFKHVSQTLEQHVNANPDQYPDGALLKSAIRKVQLYNKGYHSDDIGRVLQLIEAIVPISFNQVNYYYLDNVGQLLGKQQRINMGSGLVGMNMTTLNQIRYDHRSYQSHSLKPLLEQSFGDAAPTPIDGNAWLNTKKEQREKLDIARQARYEYHTYERSNSDDFDSHFDDDMSLE